ncbi:hypothetical protein NL676_016597 [Syzygium grande]|nr:hypothetical protein NL676_016597 [Syzygium grande]
MELKLIQMFMENIAVLAAWFRLKYPHIAIGALSSSSPILNFFNITSPYSFNDIVTRDFRVLSLSAILLFCFWLFLNRKAFNDRLELGIRNSMDADYLKGWLETALVCTAMTDYPTPSNFLNPLPAYPVKQMCKEIDDPSKGDDDFSKLYSAANIYYNCSGSVSCFDLMDDSDPHGPDGWSWQRAIKRSIFPAYKYNYNDTVANCASYFGVIPRPTWIPTEFGGHDLEEIWSNIIFYNGLRDSWSGEGVLKSISKSIVAIMAKTGAHHVDLRYLTSEDPERLQDVRKKEINIISGWISQYYLDLAKSSS